MSKKVPTAKNCADVGTKPSLGCFSTSVVQPGLVILLTMDPDAPQQDDGDEPSNGSGDGGSDPDEQHRPNETDRKTCNLLALIVNEFMT